MAWVCILLLSVCFFLQTKQIVRMKRQLDAITSAAASFLEVRPNE